MQNELERKDVRYQRKIHHEAKVEVTWAGDRAYLIYISWASEKEQSQEAVIMVEYHL